MPGLQSSTFMKQHGAGLNSTGLYLISGIPFLRNCSGANNAAFPIAFPSLTREITITVSKGSVLFHFDGAVQPDGTWDETKDASEDALNPGHAAANEFVIDATPTIVRNEAADDNVGAHGPGAVTVTLPVRVKGMYVKCTSNGTVASICATCIGKDHPYYPRVPGDGTELKNSEAPANRVLTGVGTS